MGSISTVIKYLSDTAKTNDDVINPALSFHKRKLAYRQRPETDFDYRRIQVSSMRGKEKDFTIARQGIEVATLRSHCLDFRNTEEVKRVYYAEVVALLKAVTGAQFVRPYDHTVRYQTEVESLAAPEDNSTADIHGPSRIVHVDDTPGNAHLMIGDQLSDAEAAQWGWRDFAIINVWKPLERVRRDPLALIDARTISSRDRLAQPLPAPSASGHDWEVFMLRWSADHEWWYMPDQETHEALVFKIYDSRAEDSFMGAAHVSIEDPATQHIPEARQSIEVRSLVFF